MKKPSRKPLTLNAQTVRQLGSTELGNAAGGSLSFGTANPLSCFLGICHRKPDE